VIGEARVEKISFNIQLTVGDLYYFMMYHYYKGLSGAFGLLLSIAAAIALCANYSTMNGTTRLFFLIVALAFTVINPIWMLMKARAQIARNQSLGGDLTYILDDRQFTIAMGEEHVDIKWDQVTKVRDNGRALIVYVTSIRGYIWPKKQIASEYEQILAILKENVKPGKLHLKKKDR
jgi:hypothetical protein